jgi:hypothetical protein
VWYYMEAISARDRTIIAVPGPATRNPQTNDDGPPFSKPDWNPLAVASHEAARVMPNAMTGTLLRYLYDVS